MTTEFTVNGQGVAVDVPPGTRLLEVLRNDLGLNGPKFGCGYGQCGACSVLVDGQVARACVMPVEAARGRAVTTLEGLAGPGGPHPVQKAFVACQAAQCGYCLNGMIMQSVALLAAHPDPDEATIRRALRDNLCRCGTHLEILAAVRRAAAMMADAEGGA